MKSRKLQIVAAISLNGKIADQSGSFAKYSSKEDQEYLQKKIKESDVLVMGRKTFEQHVKKTKKPIIIFTKKANGLKTEKKGKHDIYWFNDSFLEFMNLIELLQYRTVTILGGSEIYHWFIENKIVTDIFLSVEPYIITKGINLLTGDLIKDSEKWRLVSSKKLNQKGTLLLHYQC